MHAPISPRWTEEQAYSLLSVTASRDGEIETVYELWLASWDTSLAAVATASQTGALSAPDAARHRSLVAAEREIVLRQLTLLVREGGSYRSRTPNRQVVRGRTRLSDDALRPSPS